MQLTVMDKAYFCISQIVRMLSLVRIATGSALIVASIGALLLNYLGARNAQVECSGVRGSCSLDLLFLIHPLSTLPLMIATGLFLTPHASSIWRTLFPEIDHDWKDAIWDPSQAMSDQAVGDLNQQLLSHQTTSLISDVLSNQNFVPLTSGAASGSFTAQQAVLHEQRQVAAETWAQRNQEIHAGRQGHASDYSGWGQQGAYAQAAQEQAWDQHATTQVGYQSHDAYAQTARQDTWQQRAQQTWEQQNQQQVQQQYQQRTWEQQNQQQVQQQYQQQTWGQEYGGAIVTGHTTHSQQQIAHDPYTGVEQVASETSEDVQWHQDDWGRWYWLDVGLNEWIEWTG